MNYRASGASATMLSLGSPAICQVKCNEPSEVILQDLTPLSFLLQHGPQQGRANARQREKETETRTAGDQFQAPTASAPMRNRKRQMKCTLRTDDRDKEATNQFRVSCAHGIPSLTLWKPHTDIEKRRRDHRLKECRPSRKVEPWVAQEQSPSRVV